MNTTNALIAFMSFRLNSFWKFNRNLRRLLNGEENRTRNLKYGRLACVSTLDEWPKTQHDRRTFTVDLTIYNVSKDFKFY